MQETKEYPSLHKALGMALGGDDWSSRAPGQRQTEPVSVVASVQSQMYKCCLCGAPEAVETHLVIQKLGLDIVSIRRHHSNYLD